MRHKLKFISTRFLGLLAGWLLVSLLNWPRPAAAQAPARTDSARAQTLSTDTRTLHQLDSLRRQTTARLGQLQQELLTLKNRPDRARERELAQEFIALRAADSLHRSQVRRHIDSLKLRTHGYPVVPHADTLFYVYTKLGPFSPRERAALIADKVQRLEANVRYQPDSLRLYPSEQTIDLMYGELVVQSISDNDALWMNTPRDSLARQYRARIVQAVAQYKQAHSIRNILKEVGLVLLVLVAFYFVVRFVNQFFRWLQRQLTQREAT